MILVSLHDFRIVIMAKKVIEETNEHSFSLFNSIGGIIGTIITVGTSIFGIGWKIGSWRTENEYENKIRDLQYEKLRLEVEFQNKLHEEKSKWENEQEQKVTLQEISLFIKKFNDYQKEKKTIQKLYIIIVLVIAISSIISSVFLYQDNTRLKQDIEKREILLTSALNQDSTWREKQDSIIKKLFKNYTIILLSMILQK
uniref:hypothetical protein n=1 Tax=uncultured Bacteroides sp. TaxID=162156 RepID=UPI002729EF3F